MPSATYQQATKLLSTIRHASVRDIVFDSIRGAAVRGELKPGQIITEVGLAKRLGVAQATVREALIQLEGQGFVQRRKRRTCVTALSKADIDAIYAVRIPLERLAVEWLAAREERNVEDLEGAYQRMREAAEGSNLAEFKEADLAFHYKLWAAAGNPYLQEILERLVPRLFAFAILTINQYHPERQKLKDLAELHGEIVRAVRIGDAGTAKGVLDASMDLTWLDGLQTSANGLL